MTDLYQCYLEAYATKALGVEAVPGTPGPIPREDMTRFRALQALGAHDAAMGAPPATKAVAISRAIALTE